MGMYKTAMPMARIEIRKGEMRLSILGFDLLGAVMLVQGDRTDQQHQKRDGHGGGHGPIAVAEELVPEHSADHQIVRAAEQGRDDEFADRRNEYQHGARDDAGHRQRQRHVEEGAPRGAAQIGGRFEQGMIEFLERGEQRQDHEGQIGIDDSEVYRETRAHDLQRMVDYSQPQQSGVEQAGLPNNPLERVNPQQKRGPERQDDDEQQNALRALGGSSDAVGHRIAQGQANESGEKCSLQRIKVRKAIHFVGEQILEITEIQREVDVPVGTDG